MKDFFRWIMVLPAAAVASLVVYAVVYVGNLIFTPEEGSITMIICKAVASFAFGGSFVYTGASIAPRAKGIVAIVLGSLISIMAVIGMILLSNENRLDLSQAIISVATIVGAYMLCQQVRDEEW